MGVFSISTMSDVRHRGELNAACHSDGAGYESVELQDDKEVTD